MESGIREDADPAGAPDDPLIGASAEPRRRPLTSLAEEELDAMRTARANGVSVSTLARQFGIHRGTVWMRNRQEWPNICDKYIETRLDFIARCEDVATASATPMWDQSKNTSEKYPRLGSSRVPTTRPRSRNRLNSSQLVSGNRPQA